MSEQLMELSNSLAKLTETTAKSVVAIHTGTRGSSSGVVWSEGLILTAEHALRRDEEIHVTLPNGRVVSASLVGRDPSTDLAVLKCAEAGAPSFKVGSPESAKPGNLVLVVGQTRVSGPVAAFGVVSLAAAERRTWMGSSLAPYLRLDVGLQPTAVGGAVIDASGALLGIATPRFARFGVVAVAAKTMDRVSETLLKKGRIPRGYLGVALQPVRLPEQLRESLKHPEKTAAMILEVEAGGPAHKAGIVIGDILVSLEGEPVARPENIQRFLQSENVGKTLKARLVRGGAVQEAAILVGDRTNEEA